MTHDWFLATIIITLACIAFASINIYYAGKDVEKFVERILDEDRRI